MFRRDFCGVVAGRGRHRLLVWAEHDGNTLDCTESSFPRRSVLSIRHIGSGVELGQDRIRSVGQAASAKAARSAGTLDSSSARARARAREQQKRGKTQDCTAIAQDCIIAQAPAASSGGPFSSASIPRARARRLCNGAHGSSLSQAQPPPPKPSIITPAAAALGSADVTSNHAQSETPTTPRRALRAAPLPPSPPLPTTASART
ncbi:hypothetical protein SNOG_05098 [Parastagonospora nodorum SN15]|uniref:Uncharacterized protein n=1 Tax=Phaeosphaeria nodorum (strain SN15 / ATCC MYA-4574 / FGSC 10173) TaxID=321614 RepID=Q0UT16_PHANO|nr:hypothetical protein SNOG_05098 [Parastagonospora nodorum SN15]EAT87489.1 hypothetical protein SNOG_05098 [Parastagonospora nodorum SN15]